MPVFFTYSPFLHFLFICFNPPEPPPPFSHASLSPPSLLCITYTVKTSHFPSKLELGCLYTERSQVKSAKWRHQNESRKLRLMSKGPGSVITVVPIPITSDTAGDYTCILQLTNGKTVWATQAVALPQEGEKDGMVPSRLVCVLIFFINNMLYF